MKYRTIISFEPEQMNFLKDIAKREKMSISAIVRSAVDNFTKKEEKNSAKELLKWLKANEKELKKGFKDEDRNLSSRIDELMYGI